MKTFVPIESVTFKKSNEAFGDFSNMHMKFPFYINGIQIKCVEGLYQAFKFPLNPNIQSEILSQKSPMAMKYISRKYKTFVRTDWDSIRVETMKICVSCKFYTYKQYFEEVFKIVNNKHIVEYSERDSFWGAKLINGVLVGNNMLGSIIEEIRDNFDLTNHAYIIVPEHLNLLLLGHQITKIEIRNNELQQQVNFKL
jgi:N-glycosidase YbiA